MSTIEVVVFAGLVNWLATTIVVESELFRPLREWIGGKTWQYTIYGGKTAREDHYEWQRPKLAYFLGCHLCTGTWIGLAEACVLRPLPWSGLAGIAASGLLFKAVGHLVLDIVATARAWRDQLERA